MGSSTTSTAGTRRDLPADEEGVGGRDAGEARGERAVWGVGRGSRSEAGRKRGSKPRGLGVRAFPLGGRHSCSLLGRGSWGRSEGPVGPSESLGFVLTCGPFEGSSRHPSAT